MSTETLTRADLTESVFQSVGLSRHESAQMVEDMLEEVCVALARGGTVEEARARPGIRRPRSRPRRASTRPCDP